MYSINHRERLAVLLAIRGFLHLLQGQSVSLFTDNMMALSYLRKEGGTRSSTLNAVAQAMLRLLRGDHCSSAPPICTGTTQRSSGLPQSGFSDPGLRVDPLYERLPGAVSALAGHRRPLRHLAQPPAPGLLFSNGGSPSGGNRRDAPLLGSTPGLRVSTIRPHSEGPHQGSPVSRRRGDSGGSLLATEVVVPGPLGVPSGSAGPSAYAEGSSQTSALPSFPSEPPRTRSDWLSYCERSAHHFGFSLRVTHQHIFCRCPSTRMNHQAKWATYRSWCRSHGHSISRPSISKVADFLLYLLRSLHLSYSSVASYRSMLSAVFSLSSWSYPLILSFMTSCGLFVTNVLSLPRGCLLGIFFAFSLFFGILPSNISPLVLSGISPVRFSFSFP